MVVGPAEPVTANPSVPVPPHVIVREAGGETGVISSSRPVNGHVTLAAYPADDGGKSKAPV